MQGPAPFTADVCHVGTSENSSYRAGIFNKVLAAFKPSGRPGTCSNALKDDVPVEETELDDCYLLLDAICIEYLNPCIYEEKHVLKFKYSVRHVRRMAAELPEGLKDNTKEHTLFRA
eukprot:695661-Rhodomonas_salina.1